MTPQHILYSLIVTFLWGSNFIAAQKGLEYFPPYLMLAMRFAGVGVLMLPFFWRRTIRFSFVFRMALVLGAMHFGLVFGAMAYGIDIPTAVITVQLGVPFSCMLSAIFFKDKLGPWRSFGLVVAFIGMVLIAGTPNVVQHFWPFVMAMAGAFCWAVSNVWMKQEGKVRVMELVCWQSLMSAVFLLLFSLLVEHDHLAHIASATPEAWLAIGYSAVLSTIVAYGLWYYLLTQCEVSKVAPFNLLVPLFGIGVAQLFYPTHLPPQIIIGGLITLAGVAIIVLRRPRLAEVFIRFSRRRKES